MRTLHHTLLAIGVAGLMACGNGGGNTHPDGSGGPDGTANDTGQPVIACNTGLTCVQGLCTNDAGAPADTGPAMDTGPAPDASSLSGSCAMPVDLNARGMRTGTATSITGDNSMAPAAAMGTVANPSCASDAMAMTTHASYEVVFSYRMQTAGFIVASTDSPTTTQTFDTIVWVLDACSATGNELGCNDDGPNNVQSVAATSRSLAAGAQVFIVVAGYMPPGGGNTNHAVFNLTVTEFAGQAVGATCDMTHPFCVDTATCVPAAGSMTMGTCVANGAANANCRTSAPFCDSGLGCTQDAPTAAAPGVCETPVAMDGVCSSTMSVCSTGQHCVPDAGSSTMGHCRNDGVMNGRCRLTGMACDTGLACSQSPPTAAHPGICQTPVAMGGVCSSTMFVCTMGQHCIADQGSMTMGHCLSDGAENGECNLAAPFCTTGLACSVTTPSAAQRGTCQTPIADGAACTNSHFVCVPGDSCILDSATAMTGHCIADGTNGGACRM